MPGRLAIDFDTSNTVVAVWDEAQQQGVPLPTQLQKDERLLALERQVQNLRLELAKRNQLVDKLKQELERQRASESERITTAIQTQIEYLLTDAAAPATQLFAQAYLLEVKGKPVQAKDVLLSQND